VYSQRNFEKSLTKGTLVTVKWVDGGKPFSGSAAVFKLNKASIVVELDHKIGKFPPGYKIKVPRSDGGRWTNRECVLPISLFQSKTPDR
jgi:hypothetical protein